jgi:HEPN domain-containing protein
VRREIELWFAQAGEDLITARHNASGERWYAAAFFCQQAVENALKAYFMFAKKLPPDPSHSLIYLAKQAGVERRFHRFLKELTPEYVLSRYPDISDALPAQLYDDETIQDYLKRSQEVVDWLGSKMGLSPKA